MTKNIGEMEKTSGYCVCSDSDVMKFVSEINKFGKVSELLIGVHAGIDGYENMWNFGTGITLKKTVPLFLDVKMRKIAIIRSNRNKELYGFFPLNYIFAYKNMTIGDWIIHNRRLKVRFNIQTGVIDVAHRWLW